jgi:hypothetical protein
LSIGSLLFPENDLKTEIADTKLFFVRVSFHFRPDIDEFSVEKGIELHDILIGFFCWILGVPLEELCTWFDFRSNQDKAGFK